LSQSKHRGTEPTPVSPGPQATDPRPSNIGRVFQANRGCRGQPPYNSLKTNKKQVNSRYHRFSELAFRPLPQNGREARKNCSGPLTRGIRVPPVAELWDGIRRSRTAAAVGGRYGDGLHRRPPHRRPLASARTGRTYRDSRTPGLGRTAILRRRGRTTRPPTADMRGYSGSFAPGWRDARPPARPHAAMA